jgi:Protein of unknown function (DUF3099)
MGASSRTHPDGNFDGPAAICLRECNHGVVRRSREGQPLLITTAPESRDDEYERRRKRYGLMMAGRVVCVIAAATTYHVSIWLALGFVIGGAVLPWCAVIIANDRPARRRGQPVRPTAGPAERALPGPSDRNVDG